MRRKRIVLAAVLIGLIATAVFAANGKTTVYITNTGEKYHTERCASVKKSKIAISLEDAVKKGYAPCKRCNPPKMD
jgi:methylphosphotriester-DNA--protein-cysteine methyltransferase